jgi:hypothetical protein
MYSYIYDSITDQKKYFSTLAKIETRITDLGLSGKINRLSVTTNISGIITDEVRKGAKTIVAVGNDQTISKVINTLAKHQLVLGIIPIGNKEENLIASCLGIDLNEKACDTLSARRLVKLDLGKANNIFFLVDAKINNQHTVIKIQNNLTLEALTEGQTKIINLPLNYWGGDSLKFNPQDGNLELLVETKKSQNFLKKITGKTVFTLKNLTIYNDKDSLLVDNVNTVIPPVEISIHKQKLNVIVGKNRFF